MKFEFLEDITADAGFVAYGKNESELFENSSCALFSLMCDIQKVGKREKREIELQRENLTDLLFDYLNELIFLKDSQTMFLSQFDINVQKNATYNLFVQLFGEKIDTSLHTLKVDVKAVTRHKFTIERKGGLYRATVVVDI